MEFTLLGAAFVAAMAIYATLYWEAKRGNAASCTRNLWDVALTAIIVGLVAGRVAAMLSDGVNPFTNPGDLLIVRGGIATGPASVAALATVAWLGRDELWSVTDGLAAAGLAGLSGWHAGCLVRDACLGTTSDLPWAMAQTGSTVTRHPVEIYAALLYAIGAAAIIVWRSRSRLHRRTATGISIALAGLVRLITEPMRPTLDGGPILWYSLAVLAGVGILVWSQTETHRLAGAKPSET